MSEEPVRLSKLMAQRGICSRREADDFISRGLVLVDGVKIDTLGTKVLPHQSITLAEAARDEQPVAGCQHVQCGLREVHEDERVLADVEANAKLLRDKQGVVEIQILAAPAVSWSEAVAKARYVLNLYSAGLSPTDTHHRDLVAAVLADFARLAVDET
jgi:ribosomal protein S4